MRGIGTVLRRDFREIRKTTAFRILVIIFAVVTIAIAVGVSISFNRAEWLGTDDGKPMLDLIIGVVTYFLTLAILMSFIWVSSSMPVTKEKVNGNIESLLATPLAPQAIWMGKCLAIFLPAFILSVVSLFVVILVINFAAIIPASADFFLPAPILLTGFIINPLLFFGLLSFIILFSLINNPDIAIMPSFLVGFGLMIGIPVGILIGAIDLGSWSFALWYLVAAGIIWIIVGYLSRLLTREQIVLSSKGG